MSDNVWPAPTFELLEFAGDKAAWLEARKRGVGASEVPAALGLSRWKTPLQLWAEKTGRAPVPNIDNEHMRRGRDLEPVVGEHFAEGTGMSLRRPSADPYYLVRDREKPYLQATPDFLVCLKGGGFGLMEAKSPGLRATDDWSGDDPPADPQYQLQAQLMVTGLSVGWVAALLLEPWGCVWKEFPAHAKFQEKMAERLAAFWRCVETESPPAEPTGRDVELLRELYPGDRPVKPMPMDSSWVLVWEEMASVQAALTAARKDTRSLYERRDALEAKVRAELKDAREGILEDGRSFKLTHYDRKAHRVAATTVHKLKLIGG